MFPLVVSLNINGNNQDFIIIIIIVGVGRGRPNSNPSLKRTESGRTKRAAKITRNQEVTRRERPYTTVLSQRHVGTRSKLRDLN